MAVPELPGPNYDANRSFFVSAWGVAQLIFTSATTSVVYMFPATYHYVFFLLGIGVVVGAAVGLCVLWVAYGLLLRPLVALFLRATGLGRLCSRVGGVVSVSVFRRAPAVPAAVPAAVPVLAIAPDGRGNGVGEQLKWVQQHEPHALDYDAFADSWDYTNRFGTIAPRVAECVLTTEFMYRAFPTLRAILSPAAGALDVTERLVVAHGLGAPAGAPETVAEMLDSDRHGFRDFAQRIERAIASAASDSCITVPWSHVYPELLVHTHTAAYSTQAAGVPARTAAEYASDLRSTSAISSILTNRRCATPGTADLGSINFHPSVLEWLRTYQRLYVTPECIALNVQKTARELLLLPGQDTLPTEMQPRNIGELSSGKSVWRDPFASYAKTGSLLASCNDANEHELCAHARVTLRDAWFCCLVHRDTERLGRQEARAEHDKLLRHLIATAVDLDSAQYKVSNPLFPLGLKFEVDYKTVDETLSDAYVAREIEERLMLDDSLRATYVSLLLRGHLLCFREAISYIHEPYDRPMAQWSYGLAPLYLARRLLHRVLNNIRGPRRATYHICVALVKSHDVLAEMLAKHRYCAAIAAPYPSIFWGRRSVGAGSKAERTWEVLKGLFD